MSRYTPPPPRPPPLPSLRPIAPTQIGSTPLSTSLRTTPTHLSRPTPASSRTTPRPKSPSESPPMPPPLPPFLLALFCGSAPQDFFFPNCAACRTITPHAIHTDDTQSSDTAERPEESVGTARWFGMCFFPALQQQKKEGEAGRERIKDMSRRLNQLESGADKTKR